MLEAPLLVWKDAEGGDITLVNAAAFTTDLLEMSKKSVYHFGGEDGSERASRALTDTIVLTGLAYRLLF